MAGPLLGPTPALNPRRRSPRHQNDEGAPNVARHANTHQVNQNPPRFELIESDEASDNSATSSEEVELDRKSVV